MKYFQCAAERLGHPQTEHSHSIMGRSTIVFQRKLHSKEYKNLWKATVRSYHYHSRFLPKSQPREIVTDAAVQFELCKHNNPITKIWTKHKAP
jgi:hypothetical protein